MSSVRGYQQSSLGPQDAQGGVLGGIRRTVGNEEILFPIPGLAQERSVRLGAFFDIGQVWNPDIPGQNLSDIADDVFADGRPFFDVDRERGAWLLAVPVRVQDQPLGILIAINAVNHGLLPEHTAFLSILGAFAAVSIANARLAEEGRYAMLASERERIFTPFYRPPGPRPPGDTGLGLGLALVRQIASYHGGEVTYVERKPHGSRFEVKLPARR